MDIGRRRWAYVDAGGHRWTKVEAGGRRWTQVVHLKQHVYSLSKSIRTVGLYNLNDSVDLKDQLLSLSYLGWGWVGVNYGYWIIDPHLGTFLWPPTSVYAL